MEDKIILYAITFLTGFAVMGYEILGVRVLAPVYGSEIFVWGAIISVFLAGLCIGYAAGGKIDDRRSDIHILSIVLFLVPCIPIPPFRFIYVTVKKNIFRTGWKFKTIFTQRPPKQSWVDLFILLFHLYTTSHNSVEMRRPSRSGF